MAGSRLQKMEPLNADSTRKTPDSCHLTSHRRCEDGSCLPRSDLCPEEDLLSQETILVMIGVAMAVFVLLIFLYCLQQKRNANLNQEELNEDEANHPELLLTPPPAYDEAVNVALYPPTPQVERISLPSSEEPTTPPPNYDTALHILAQSEENLLVSRELLPPAPNIRRAVSVDHLGINRCRPMTFSSFGANAKTFRQTKRNPPESHA